MEAAIQNLSSKIKSLGYLIDVKEFNTYSRVDIRAERVNFINAVELQVPKLNLLHPYGFTVRSSPLHPKIEAACFEFIDELENEKGTPFTFISENSSYQSRSPYGYYEQSISKKEIWKDTIGRIGNYDSLWIKERNTEEIETLIPLIRSVQREYAKYKKANPIFSYSFPICGFKIRAVPFYIEGYKGSLISEVKGNAIVLTEPDLHISVEISDHKKAKVLFPEFINSIKDKQKTRNLLNPSRHHFTTVFDYKYRHVSDKIYNALIQEYDHEDIELFCSKHPNLRMQSVSGFGDVQFFKILDTHLLIDNAEKMVFSTNDEIELFTNLEKHLDKKMKKMIKEQRSLYQAAKK